MKKRLWLIVCLLITTPLVLGYTPLYRLSNNLLIGKVSVANAFCYDTDYPSYNPFIKGEVIAKPNSLSKFYFSVSNQDQCLSMFLLEENICIDNKVQKIIIDCRIFGNFACYSGECVYTNSIPGWDGVPHEMLKDNQ